MIRFKLKPEADYWIIKDTFTNSDAVVVVFHDKDRANIVLDTLNKEYQEWHKAMGLK